MAIIFSYPAITASDADAQDRLILSKMNVDTNPTKSITLADLSAFIKGTPTGGLGTTNFISKWVDGPNSILGDSILQEDGAGTFVTCQGNFQTTGNIDLLGNDIINVEDFKIDGDIYDVNGNTGVAGEVLSSLGIGNGVEWTSNGGTVTGTGTTDKVTKWVDGPNGVLGDSSITDTGVADGVEIEPAALRKWTFAPGGTFSYISTGPANVFEFKEANDGYYNSNFRFTGTLAVDRSSQATGASLDVGVSGNPIPAAWFRNGVVVSNNPSGVQVDNTSVVIGAGNNDVVSGSDNCLTVGNGNQILNNSDHSVVFGLGNTIQNTGSASLVVGQGNTLDGTGLGPGNTARSYILGLNNTLTGSFASFIAGGQNVITTEQNAMILGFNNTTNGVDNIYALGESNTLNDVNANGVFMIGNGITGQDGNMVLGYRNDTTGYPATNYALGLGNTKLVLSVGSVTDSNAVIITEGGVNRGGGVAQVPRVFLPTVTTFSANTDAAADALGVPEGGLYQNNGVVQINRGGGSAVDPLAGGGGGVGGGGTLNTIPVWTGANTLGDSQITDDGITIEANTQMIFNDAIDVLDVLRDVGGSSGTNNQLLTSASGTGVEWRNPEDNALIGYKSVQSFVWTNGTPVAYTNWTNGTPSDLPFDATPLIEVGTYTGTAANFAWTCTNAAGGTATQEATFTLGANGAGTWKVETCQHWFDQTNQVEIRVSFDINGTLIDVIDEKSTELTGDKIFYGSLIQTFSATDTLSVNVEFVSGGVNPFPSATGNRPIEITFERLV